MIITGYDVSVAALGVGITYAIVNFWNPTGWVVAGVSLAWGVGTSILHDVIIKDFYNNKEIV